MAGQNRLAQETSPYLRQHADNPVDWYPWGPEAFERAQAEDKPILLSVGYSACHWCHVMAHESFEDEATAAVMNERFVNVKVDREQRPDVDAVYMEATQAMTGSGGWPMTVFATPDGEPFYCGTYFPRERRQGMPSFTDVLLSIHDAWATKRDQIAEQATTLTEHLRRSSLPAAEGGSLPGPEVLDGAVAALLAQHDDRLGGFGRAPKFPQTMSIDVLLRDGRPEAVAAAVVSLDHMAAGGLFDHVGGGFARYSVDAAWLVPHFEKMLYDQALLVRAYLHAWQVTGDDRHRQVLDETIGYVLRHLRHPAGGFFSAEDADSEGVEGRFHTWTVAEVVDVLGDGPEAKVALDWYGVRPEGNFEHTGRSIPNRLHAVGELARPAAIEAARAALFEARERRVRPGLDDKVLTEWNGLFVSALAEAAAATGEVAWHHAAVAGGEFLLRALRRPDGRWLRTWQADPPDPDGPGRADVLAFAADHGALVDAFTRLYELTGEARWIAEAIDAADALLELFWDDDAGGVFTVGHDGEQLVARQKDLLDGASPSASSLAAVGLLRLGALTGVDRYRERAEEIVALLGALGAEHPTSLGHLLSAVDLVVGGIDEVVVTGLRPDLVAAYRNAWRPRAVLAWGEHFESPLWHGRDEQGDAGLAYVCRHYACGRPAAAPEALAAQLR
jgi:uncharacterized protein YyaL (SSP411 family)